MRNLSRRRCGVGRNNWAVAMLLAAAPGASAVVVTYGQTRLDAPAWSYVGDWNGSSGVAIGDHWVVSARHVGGSPQGAFTLDGQAYQARRIYPKIGADLELIELADALPGWHEIGPRPAAGDMVLLGGLGQTAGDLLNDGIAWSGHRALTWGANRVAQTGRTISIQFDEPGSPAAVDGEASFAINDSGAGLFTMGEDGRPWVVGLAVSITGRYGESLHGSFNNALSLSDFIPWIFAIEHPGEPVTSSMGPPPPPSGFFHPDRVPTPGTGAAALVLGGLAFGARGRRGESR